MGHSGFFHQLLDFYFNELPEVMEEVCSESIRPWRLPIFGLSHRCFNFLEGDRSQKHLVMLFRDEFGNELRDCINGWLPVNSLVLLKSVFEVVQKYLFNFLVLFDLLSLLVGDMMDAILHSSLNSRSMEEFGVPFPFL